MKNTIQYFIGMILLLNVISLKAQNESSQINPQRIPLPSFSMLLKGNDIQTSIMADAGVGHSQLNNTGNENVAKILFNKSDWSTSVNHSNYMASIITDMSLTSLSSNIRFSTNKVGGFELNYYRTGQLKNTDLNSNLLTNYVSGEWNLAAKLALRIGLNSSLGIGIRYLYSNLFNPNTSINKIGFETNSQVLANIGYFYHGQLKQKYFNQSRKLYQRLGYQGEWYNTWGISISNIGGALKSMNSNTVSYMPTVLKVGFANNYFMQDENKFSTVFQISKLLVPTPPIRDVNGNVIRGTDDSNLNSFKAMYLSLFDAPEGLIEKLKELQFSVGLTYSIKESFYLGTGFFYENIDKGNHKYFSYGLGVKYKSIDLNLAYLVPFGENNALGNSLRVGIVYNN